MSRFLDMIALNLPRGYIRLAAPLSFEEQVELQRQLRDWEEEYGPFAIRIAKDAVAIDMGASLPSPLTACAPRRGLLTRDAIVAALEACVWNQTRAAKMLGCSRGRLVAHLDRYNLPRPKMRHTQ